MADDIPGLGNDGANEGFWRVQIRSEKTGRWVKMYGAVMFDTRHPNYGPISGVGIFEGGARPGVALVRVSGGKLNGKVIEVPTSDFEDIKAIIPENTPGLEEARKLDALDGIIVNAPTKSETDGELKEQSSFEAAASTEVQQLSRGDIVQQATPEALFGQITDVDQLDNETTRIEVMWSDGNYYAMDLPSSKVVKSWPNGWFFGDVPGVQKRGESSLLDDLVTSEGFRADFGDIPLSAVDADVISDDHRKAVDNYTRTSLWRSLNSYLRGELDQKAPGGLLAYDDSAAALDDAIAENGEVFEAGRVFRGQRIDAGSAWVQTMANLRPGDVVSDDAYLSTSNSSLLAAREFGIGSYGTWERVAEDAMSSDAPGGGGSVFWAIDVPVGSTAFAVPDGMGYAQGAEREVILPRGSRFVVKGIRRVKQNNPNAEADAPVAYNYFVDAELLPAEQKVVNAPIVEEVLEKSTKTIDDIPLNPDLYKTDRYRPSSEILINIATEDGELDSYELEAIDTYMGADYLEVNAIARKYPNLTGEQMLESVDPGTVEVVSSWTGETYTLDRDKPFDLIRDLDSAFSVSSLTKDEVVYRGIHVSPEAYRQYINLEIGDELVENAYMSTSTNLQRATDYANRADGAGGFYSPVEGNLPVLFKIKALNGTSAYQNPELERGEDELVFARNTKLKVTRISKTSKGLLVVEVETDPASGGVLREDIETVAIDAPTTEEADGWSEVDGVQFRGESDLFAGNLTSEMFVYGDLRNPVAMADSANFTYEQQRALSNYTGSDFAEINTYLRTGEIEEDSTYDEEIMKSELEEIDAAIAENGYVEEAATVFRGMKIKKSTVTDSGESWATVLENLQVGDVYYEKAYLSTSNSPAVAHNAFGSGGGGDYFETTESESNIAFEKGTAFWAINISEGGTALALPVNDENFEITGDEREEEVILPRGSGLKIKAIRRVKQDRDDGEEAYNYYIEADLLPVMQVVDEEPEIVDAPIVEEVEDFEVRDLSDFVRVGGPLGSNDGGVYEFGSEKIYVKEPQSALHGENEILASKFYERLGIKAGKVKPGRLADGTFVTYSEWIDSTSDLDKKLSDEEYLKKIQEGLGVDAWLANWDVTGSALDNIVTDTNGDPVRIDAGGALLFRARGERKGSVFGNEVLELDTLVDGTNPQSALVFGGMTEEQKKQAISKLQEISPEEIEQIVVDTVLSDPVEAAALAQTLINRRADALEKAGLSEEIVRDSGPVEDRVNVDGVEVLGESPYFDDSLTDTEFYASESLVDLKTDFSQVPDEQIKALRRYSSDDYDWINSYLRGEDSEQIQKRLGGITKSIGLIDETFASSDPIKFDKTVFRGILLNDLDWAERLENLRPGEIWFDPAYISTSVKPTVARGFSMRIDENPSSKYASDHSVFDKYGTAFFAINLPSGSKALNIADISEYSDGEAEVLLPRSSGLRIQGIRRVKQKRKDGADYYNYYIEAELVNKLDEVDSPIVEESKGGSGVLDVMLSGEDLVFDYNALPSPDLEPLDLNKVTDEQRSAMFKYVSTDYRTINTYLRNDQLVGPYGEPLEFENLTEQEKFTDSTLDIVRNLDIVISQFGSLEEPVTVYRGIQIRKDDESLREMYKTLKPGDSLVDEGYTSTSKLAKYAHGMGKSDLRENAFLVINIPAGGTALPLPVRVTEGEEEVLLPRRTEFKVKDVKIVPRVSAYGDEYNQYYVEVDVVVPETVDAPTIEEPKEEPRVFDSTPLAIFSWMEEGAEPLTNKQKDVLGWYQQAGHIRINTYLRGFETYDSLKEVAQNNVDVLDSIMDQSNGTPEDAVLYRAVVDNPDLKLEDISVGSVINDGGYMSTTATRKFVDKWLETEGSGDGFVFKLLVPKGTKAVVPYAKIEDKDFKHEYEVILDRGANIEVTNIDYENRVVTGTVTTFDRGVEAESESEPSASPISTIADLIKNYDELLSRVEEIDSSSGSKAEKGNVPMRALLEAIGKGGKPEMVDPSVLAGREIFYRGGPAFGIDSLKYSETDRIGLGVTGDGYYFSSLTNTAEVYASMGPGGEDNGAVVSVVWKPTAKVYEFNDEAPHYDDKTALQEKGREAAQDAIKELHVETRATEVEQEIYDMFYGSDMDALTTSLILEGYDGMSYTFNRGIPGKEEKYTIVFNREALQIADI